MKKFRQGALIGIISALLFALLGLTGIFSSLESQLYDFCLGYRPKRERSDKIVFLDVDNEAIALNGVFPWPRSIMADGLLRLKEFGAGRVIFDIEYVDKGPQGVDPVSLGYLPDDFSKTFTDIDSSMEDLINALQSGQFSISEVSQSLSDYINNEREDLLNRALGIARNNDEYLAQASSLYGNSWVTLNIRNNPLEGEQASRRTMAQDLFSYPVKAAANVYKEPVVDILPPIPSFAKAARGAGFTRAFVDKDGVRRRIDLAREFNGYWYLQVAFAPLVNYLGNPGLELDKNKLVMHGAVFPSDKENSDSEKPKDITIPLDNNSRMLLDWPAADFKDSFTHFSFAAFSNLELLQAGIGRYVSDLCSSGSLLEFTSRDKTLEEAPSLLYRIDEQLTAANEQRELAVAQNSDEAFAQYLSLRSEGWRLLHQFKDLDFSSKVSALNDSLIRRFPDQAAQIRSESAYLRDICDILIKSLDNFDSIQNSLSSAVNGKFCIVGQTDAGTTDIGVNPFHNEYVNVGTEGVVLDTILSQSFITWLSSWWSAFFCLIVPVLIFAFTPFAPGLRTFFGLLAGLLLLTGAFLLFRFLGVFINPIPAVFSLAAAIAAREIIAYIDSDRERQFVRKAFTTYVSGDVVEQIISNPSSLHLGGIQRHMSVMFTDIRNFSTIAERLDPEALVLLLNRYLTTMSDLILNEKGTIDKYVGDAIVAFFGAPLELPDHASRACSSAIAIKRAETELNKKLMEQNLAFAPLLTRIGVNTGSMAAGNMGTENKMNYTIMGNSVNIAARLEGVNKYYGTWVLTTQETLAETGNKFLSRRLDKVRVVGINEPIQLYELLETREAAADWQKETVSCFEIALNFFIKQDWINASEAFQSILDFNPNDGPSRLYLERSKEYLKTPPSYKWDGIINLESK
ncbi:MAG: CHASE2 domain-containing protein [Treponema sp.]|nr:CHASE2 domain-containing protein [Treponema sp.]